MSVQNKKRTPGFIVNKTGESQRFQNYLQLVESNHPHFAATLNQNPDSFMPLYNKYNMTNTRVTAEEEALGLTNPVKMGLYTVVLMVAQNRKLVDDSSLDLLDSMIAHQLPIMEQAGLRFISEEKTVLMAAVWYSYVMGTRHEDLAHDLGNAFLDILWLFLEPTDQARAVDFDRDEFVQHIGEYFVTRNQNKKAAATPAKTEAAAPAMSYFATAVEKTQHDWFAVMVQRGIMSDASEFNAFVQNGVVEYRKAREQGVNYLAALNQEMLTQGPVVPQVFETKQSLNECFSGAMLLPMFFSHHAFYLNTAVMDELSDKAAKQFALRGWKLRGVTPGTSSEMTSLSMFYFWSAINGYASHVMTPAKDEHQWHLKFGAEMALIAENLAYTMMHFYEPADDQAVDSAKMAEFAIESVLHRMVEIARPIANISTGDKGTPVDSIFNTGAIAFYSNLSNLINKENTVMSASATASKSAATATVADEALNQAMAAMEEKMKNVFTETAENLATKIKADFAQEIEKGVAKAVKEQNKDLSDRLSKLERIVGKTADADKLKTEADKDLLKGIQEAAKAAKKGDKKKGSKRSVTGVEELTTLEKVVVGAGVGAVVGLMGYGIYKAAELFMED